MTKQTDNTLRDVYLRGSFFDHLQLALVDLDAPEKAIKKPQEDPACQPEGKYVSTCSLFENSPFEQQLRHIFKSTYLMNAGETLATISCRQALAFCFTLLTFFCICPGWLAEPPRSVATSSITLTTLRNTRSRGSPLEHLAACNVSTESQGDYAAARYRFLLSTLSTTFLVNMSLLTSLSMTNST